MNFRGHLQTMRPAFAAIAAVLLCAAPLAAQASIPAPLSPAYAEFTDEIGRSVRIPQPVGRIVSLAPSLTETIYALGAQNRLVGDTDACDYPLDAQKKEKVGGLSNPSIEKIAFLRPDLVLVTSINRYETLSALDRLHIPSYATDPHTVDDVLASSAHLAEVLGIPEAGQALTRELRRRLSELQTRLADRPPRRVLFVVWSAPLISIGKNTFIADALRRAGAVSVLDASQDWPQVNLEEVVRLQPEVLVFAASHSDADVANDFDELATRPGWRDLEAVRHRRFAVISDAVNRPSPRLVSAIEDLARRLHPEAFTEKPQPVTPPGAPSTGKDVL